MNKECSGGGMYRCKVDFRERNKKEGKVLTHHFVTRSQVCPSNLAQNG